MHRERDESTPPGVKGEIMSVVPLTMPLRRNRHTSSFFSLVVPRRRASSHQVTSLTVRLILLTPHERGAKMHCCLAIPTNRIRNGSAVHSHLM